ncbi:hypothetical protein [Halalkalibacter alkalisediminis]|uniref:Uncharacterized protein n=1 Tax=Halalkalibacter alkalisediminis TaxID=935616 RepID=A0ABV6NE34_9BACI|nr:hypothetical protein [Halalkalibacter alkalisediminis]
MADNRKGTVNIITNEAIRGKPYLDIDRVITEEGKSNSLNKKSNK